MDNSINISDQDFHSRVTGKYQKGKRNLYDFPLMIFFKNTGQFFSQKIYLNVLLLFNISKQITSQYILKTPEGIKSLLEWFMTERYVPKQQKVNSLAFINSENKKYGHLQDEDISSADNSVSWDYKFVFYNESPVLLQHVNLLLKNSKLSNSKLADSPNYSEIIINIAKSTQNKSNAYLSNYIQIINQGLHHGFETAILPHLNLLLNNISLKGDSFDSNENNQSSRSGRNYHIILPHVNLLLNTISANNIVSYAQEFSTGHTSGDGSDHSFSQTDLRVKESASDKDIHFTKVQLSNFVYHFPAILQQMDTIQKNMPEMIVSLSNSFITTIKHYPEKDYHMALSFIMPSIIKTMYKDDVKGQTSVNLEPLIKSNTMTDTSTEKHDLQFKTNRKIEEEMERIKRIAQEAKHTVIESVKNIQTSHEEEMNRKINISQLSDQVYRLLDRKITIEKERRGII